ncbi:MAG: trypsin-like serine peptidase [Thermoanaerobaculia bacterium]
MQSDQSFFHSLQSAVEQRARSGSADARLTLFLLLDALWKLRDEFGGSAITEVPAMLKEEVRAANRICRFLLEDGVTVIGTGFLVGPSHVLTAGHLFFEPYDQVRGKLIDPARPTNVLVEFLTIYAGTSMISVAPSTVVKLAKEWAVDPLMSGDFTDREVADLDFAIVKLEKAIGEEGTGGGDTRQWFQIPHPANVVTLSNNSMVRVLQYLDRGSLRNSIGMVKGVNSARTRVFHSASTRDAASGSVILNDRLQLTAVHVSGEDEENPFVNQGLPLLRIAKYLDAKGIRATVSPKINP